MAAGGVGEEVQPWFLLLTDSLLSPLLSETVRSNCTVIGGPGCSYRQLARGDFRKYREGRRFPPSLVVLSLGTNDINVASTPAHFDDTEADIRVTIKNILDDFKCYDAEFLFVMPPDQHTDYRHQNIVGRCMQLLKTDVEAIVWELHQANYRAASLPRINFSGCKWFFGIDGFHTSVVGSSQMWSSIVDFCQEGVVDVQFDYLPAKYARFVFSKTPTWSNLKRTSSTCAALDSEPHGRLLVSNVTAAVIDVELVGDRIAAFQAHGNAFGNDISFSLSLLLPRAKTSANHLSKRKHLDVFTKQRIAARIETVPRIVQSRQFVAGFDLERVGLVTCFLCPAVASSRMQPYLNHFLGIEHQIQMENCFAVKYCEELPDSFTALESFGSCLKQVDTQNGPTLETEIRADMRITITTDEHYICPATREIGTMIFGSKRSYAMVNGFYVLIQPCGDPLYCPTQGKLPLYVTVSIRRPRDDRSFALTITAPGVTYTVPEVQMTRLETSTAEMLDMGLWISIPAEVKKFGANFFLVELLAVCKYTTVFGKSRTNVCQAVFPVMVVAENGVLADIVDDLTESPGDDEEISKDSITLFNIRKENVIQHPIRSEGDESLPRDDEVDHLRMSVASIPERNYFKVISYYSKIFSDYTPPSINVLNNIELAPLNESEFRDNLCFLAFPSPLLHFSRALDAISEPVTRNNFPLHIAVSLCKELVDAHKLIPVCCEVLNIDPTEADRYTVFARCTNNRTKEHLRKLFHADLVVKSGTCDDVHYLAMVITDVDTHPCERDIVVIGCMLPSAVNKFIQICDSNRDWTGISIYESKDRKDATRSVTMVCKAAAAMMSQTDRFENVERELDFDFADVNGHAERLLLENIKYEYWMPQQNMDIQFDGRRRRVMKTSVGKYQKLKAIHHFSRNSSENLKNFLDGLMAPADLPDFDQIDGEPMCNHPGAVDYQCSCFHPDVDNDALLTEYRPIDAVMRSVEGPSHTTVLHGPVGTGKTYTSTNFAIEYVVKNRENQPKVLLIAETNEAALTIFEQLMDAGEEHDFAMKDVTYFVSSTEYRRKKYSPELFPNVQPVWSVREEIDAQKRSYVDREESDGPFKFETIMDIFRRSVIIVSTRNLALRLIPRCRVLNSNWNRLVVLVDEASQITFPEMLFLVPYAKRLVCVGDVKQTGPYMTRLEAGVCLPLSKCSALAFIQTCKQLQDPTNQTGSVVKLYCNFRFSSSCAEFISNLWYQNDHPLVAVHNNKIDHVLAKLSEIDAANILGDHFDESSHRLAVVNIEGQSTYCQNKSMVNVPAASAAVYIIRHLADLGLRAVGYKILKRFRVGVLSLNTSQRCLVEEYCRRELLSDVCEIEFLTIRKAQGKTFDFVVLSIEQSDFGDRLASSGYSSGFSNTRDQILVAVSRMRYGMFLICNMHRLLAEPESTLFKMIRHIPHRALYCNDQHPSISSSPMDVIHWVLKVLLCDDGTPTKAQVDNLTAMGQLMRQSVTKLRSAAGQRRDQFTSRLEAALEAGVDGVDHN